MASPSDDDVPGLMTGHDEHPDGDTTAAAVAPALPADADEERTVQQPVDSAVGAGARDELLEREAPTSRSVPTPHITSKKMTVVGLGAPPPTLVAAGVRSAPPAPASLDTVVATEADEDDNTVTAAAPAPASQSVKLPLTIPGTVRISELAAVEDDEEGDETEVRTLVGVPSSEVVEAAPRAPAPAPAAGVPAIDPDSEDDLEDSITTQTPSAIKGARLPEDEPATSPLRQRPLPAAGRGPDTHAVKTIDPPNGVYDPEESVTTRGPALLESGDVPATAQGAFGLSSSVDDGTEGTTKRLARAAVKRGESIPADSELESVTTRAPGHLTNMLRVIASSETPGADGVGAIETDEDDLIENKTAVMLGAPVKPASSSGPAALSGPAGSSRSVRGLVTGLPGQSGGSHAVAAAELREPSSDSGLRVARASPPPSGDHASLSLLRGGDFNAAGYPDERANRDGSPIAFANTEAFAAPTARVPDQNLQEFDFADAKKPRYGLLVTMVALLSFAIPLALFLWLQGNVDAPLPARSPSELALDPVGRADAARARAPKASSSPKSNGFPRRR